MYAAPDMNVSSNSDSAKDDDGSEERDPLADLFGDDQINSLTNLSSSSLEVADGGGEEEEDIRRVSLPAPTPLKRTNLKVEDHDQHNENSNSSWNDHPLLGFSPSPDKVLSRFAVD